MFDCITLNVPASSGALMVVRLTTAGAAASGNMDYETLEDVKTAVYEACYAMTMQKYIPEKLTICYQTGDHFAVRITGSGERTLTNGRFPDRTLCDAVLTTMIDHVDVQMDEKGITQIEMSR